MARPRRNIRAKAVIELAKIGCTKEEMGRVLGCDPTTIGRRFADEIEQGTADLKVRLRRKQISAALKGNIAMLIFLGKQLLGQTDKSRTELAGEVTAPGRPNVGQMSPEEEHSRILELLHKGGYLDRDNPKRAD